MIYRDGLPYLERFYLLCGPRLRVLLHHFHASDPEDLHDHPWKNFSLVLRGDYFEHIPHPSKATVIVLHRRRGDFVLRDAMQAHRIIVAGQSTISLFITGRRVRNWGFFTKAGWVPATAYSGQPVDIEGEHFEVRGWLFPKVRWLVPQERRVFNVPS